MADFEWPTLIEAESHIRGELQRLGLRFREDRNSFSIVCPYPHPGGGVNSHLNYRIKKDGKTSHCFVCKSTGSWQHVAGDIGASKFNSSGLYDDAAAALDMGAALRRRQLLSLEEDDPAEVPAGLTPWAGSWRGMSEAFLTRAKAARWLQPWYGEWVERIWFPCYQYGDYAGYAARRLDKVDDRRWFNAPWMKAQEVLFGFDLARSFKSDAVCVCEGPADALTLLHAGIPAVATLGTNNIGQKESLVYSAGWRRAYVVFDNDPGGVEAAPKMMARLQLVMPYTENILLPPGKDPGNLDANELRWLREHVKP